MSKVIQSFSLDQEIVKLLDDHHQDAYGKIGSKSATVNSAIRHYLAGSDAAQMEEQIANMQAAIAKYRHRVRELESEIRVPASPDQRSWWKKLLGI